MNRVSGLRFDLDQSNACGPETVKVSVAQLFGEAAQASLGGREEEVVVRGGIEPPT